jgi:hypothetical protein
MLAGINLERMAGFVAIRSHGWLLWRGPWNVR